MGSLKPSLKLNFTKNFDDALLAIGQSIERLRIVEWEEPVVEPELEVWPRLATFVARLKEVPLAINNKKLQERSRLRSMWQATESSFKGEGRRHARELGDGLPYATRIPTVGDLEDEATN